MTDEAKKMTHEDVMDVIPWYVNRTLSTQEQLGVEAHLQDCAVCRAEYAAQTRIRDAVLMHEATPMLSQPNADAVIDGDRRRRKIGRGRLLALAAAIAAIAVISTTILIAPPDPGDINLQYEMLTSDGYASTIDVVVEVLFSAATDAAEHRRILTEFGGSDIAVSEQGPEYRLTIRGQPASLDHINAIAEALAAQPGVESARVVALQVPMQ